MGVSMLPRFAAAVCSTTSGMASRSHPAISSTTSPKGTKVMRATSLVTSMLTKKGRKVSTSSICRVVESRPSSPAPSASNTPCPCRPLLTAIRLNSRARVSQSM